MERILSCCGVVCSECRYYPKECTGCPDIKGKPYWLDYTGEEICSIYDCCVITKQIKHCGKCAELPCEQYDGEDPTKTAEENEYDHSEQLRNLKSRLD